MRWTIGLAVLSALLIHPGLALGQIPSNIAAPPPPSFSTQYVDQPTNADCPSIGLVSGSFVLIEESGPPTTDYHSLDPHFSQPREGYCVAARTKVIVSRVTGLAAFTATSGIACHGYEFLTKPVGDYLCHQVQIDQDKIQTLSAQLAAQGQLLKDLQDRMNMSSKNK